MTENHDSQGSKFKALILYVCVRKFLNSAYSSLTKKVL